VSLAVLIASGALMVGAVRISGRNREGVMT
jgi:hypothetical protein